MSANRIDANRRYTCDFDQQCLVYCFSRSVIRSMHLIDSKALLWDVFGNIGHTIDFWKRRRAFIKKRNWFEVCFLCRLFLFSEFELFYTYSFFTFSLLKTYWSFSSILNNSEFWTPHLSLTCVNTNLFLNYGHDSWT